MPGEDYRERVKLDGLRLDPQNPRLARDEDWGSKPETHLLKEFAKKYNLLELARSIADKGFTPRHAEALLAVEESDGTLTVVEGNRRLATVKLLTDGAKRTSSGATSEQWASLAAQAEVHGLTQVPVIVYADRESLDDYLGFRHITGPTPWRPEAKARFIAKLLSHGELIGDVARRIGSNHRTVRRYAEAHQIYTQAAEFGLEMDQVEAGFGVFYNALDRPGVRELLGLGRQAEITTLPDSPVPVEKLDDLVDLIGLLYGDSERSLDKVIRESRDLRKLDRVLANDKARANLFRHRDLDRAWRVGGGGRDELLAILSDLYSRLAEVNGQSREYADDHEVRSDVKRIHALVEDMAARYQVKEL